MADPFKVKVDETVTLKLNQAANSVVVGNATVADVTVHDARTLLVTGKAFGSTNLTVLDRAGNTIYTSQLTVGGEDDNGLTIVRSGYHLLVLMRRQVPRHADGWGCSGPFLGRDGDSERQAGHRPRRQLASLTNASALRRLIRNGAG